MAFTPTGDEGYYPFGRDRHPGAVGTDFRFTGQKTDASGLMYYNARDDNPD